MSTINFFLRANVYKFSRRKTVPEYNQDNDTHSLTQRKHHHCLTAQ